MSSYGTLEDRPDINSDVIDETCTDTDLSPLRAVNIPLRPEHGQPGTANEDRLLSLIAKGNRDPEKKGWSAADYNNLACAYFWHNRERGKKKAIDYFTQALSHNPATDEEKTIKCNLALVQAP